jgi:hypothetical protein
LNRRIIGAAVAAVAVLAAYGCGGGNSGDTSVRSGTHGATVHAADGASDATGLQTVSYSGVEFEVPASWPVYDLAADPTTCVRFDVHAVYLGRPAADMVCPAGLVGRVDAVLVEPDTGGYSKHDQAATASAQVSTADVNGLQAEVADGGDVTYQVDASFPSAGVSATLTYQDSDATVQQILHSFRGAAK